MKIIVGTNGIDLVRECCDRAISHETTVTHHLRKLLNQRDGGGWVRCRPEKMGLTDCRQGVMNRKSGTVYWHERYQIEDAHKAFNGGQVFYLKTQTSDAP